MADEVKNPPWFEGDLPPKSFRSIFKWGSPNEHKHPNQRLVDLMKVRLKVTDANFRLPVSLGLEPVPNEYPVGLAPEQVAFFINLLGEENVESDTYARLRASYGQGMIDGLRLRAGFIENIPDLVLHPSDKRDVEEIIAYSNAEAIPIYVVSGRSSVTRGFEAVRGGVTLDISTHMNQVLDFNEINQTITVQPGISGPALEAVLNDAPRTLGAQRAYTCGHFPQSFEFSTVGGWVLTRGAGQNSTYYGKIEDLVISQEYVTPIGIIKTQDFPRQATGPDIDQIMIGSEGIFGVLVAVTLKVFRYRPENRVRFSYMFRNWADARQAAREIMQAEAGFPSVFRISDSEETEVAMQLYGIADTFAEKILSTLGYTQGEKCLMLGYTEGDSDFAKTLNRKIKAIAKSYHAFNLSPFGVTRRWEHGRFSDPYLRDSLLDFGVLTDTLECSVTWEGLADVHSNVRSVIKSRPNSICMTHISHAYPQGANLYFIFITKSTGIQDYLRFQYTILDAIQSNGASMSHHHGLGKQLAPWLPGQVGEEHMALLRNLKDHFDPNAILNPGGTLGLDMTTEQTNKTWGLDGKYNGGDTIPE